jgi:hypothetical protein
MPEFKAGSMDRGAKKSITEHPLLPFGVHLAFGIEVYCPL